MAHHHFSVRLIARYLAASCSHTYMGLVPFTIHARVDEMSLVTMEGNAAALLRCPCYEWSDTLNPDP